MLFFLAPSYVEAAAREALLTPELMAALETAARRIDANPTRRALAWHVYRCLFHAPAFDAAAVTRWPLPRALLGDDAGLVYLLVLLGGLPEMRVLYRARGMPDHVARDTLHDVQRWADHYRRHHGVWGIAPAHLPWLRLHLRGELYALGRLQFQPGPWTLPARAFRHHVSGEVTALSAGGVRYRADGQRDGAGGVRDPCGAWTASLELGVEGITGHRIVPAGRAERAKTRLAAAEWAQVLAPGDAVLHLHIPRGEPLELDACRRSLEEASRFFPAHLPEAPFVAFACASWLLDAQLADLLPPASNLVRFQRQFYLVPAADDGTATLGYVFDGVPASLARAPRDTALRRVLLDHLRQGGHLRVTGGFLPRDDLPSWGSDRYQSV